MKIILQRSKKLLLIVAAALFLLVASIGGTLAWLTHKTDAVINTFTPGDSKAEVVKGADSEDASKDAQTVLIKNAGNIPVFVRAAIVPVWRDGDNHIVGLSPGQYSLATGKDWVEKDGFYYHTASVPVDGATGALIEAFSVQDDKLGSEYEGLTLDLQVLAQSIQAEGVTEKNIPAVTDAWGISVSGSGQLIVPTSGSSSLKQ